MTKEEFSNKLWITYKARFNAHSRLLKQESFSTMITSFLSLFVIAFNILQIMPMVLKINQSTTTFYTITVSIFILAISLMNYSSTRRHDAERFHICALEIKGLYEEFSAIQHEMTNDNYVSYIQKYNSIEKKYEINHSKYDSEQVLIEREQEPVLKIV